MSGKNRELDSCLEQAARWQARFAIGRMQISAVEQAEFQDWLNTSAEHREVWQQLLVMESDLHMLSALARESDRVLTPNLRHTYRHLTREITGRYSRERQTTRRLKFYQYFGAIAASLLLVAVGVLASWEFFKPGPQIYSTAIGEQRNLMLSDGSLVTLNTNSRIAVAITTTNRRLHLEKGEAYFDVAKERQRPFIVSVQNSQVRALGTTFNIKYREGETEVIVTEGRVEVAIALPDTSVHGGSLHHLQAGERVVYSQGKVQKSSLEPKDLATSVIWREGLLVFDQRKLADVIEEVQHYIPQQIVFSQRDMGEEVVGGLFEIDNLDTLIDAIANSLSIHVMRERNIILFTRRSAIYPDFKNPSQVSREKILKSTGG